MSAAPGDTAGVDGPMQVKVADLGVLVDTFEVRVTAQQPDGRPPDGESRDG